MILRDSDIFESNEDKKIEDYSSVYYFNFYIKLFNSFWNRANWGKLFPSMPDFAVSVQTKKKVIIDLMIEKRKNKYRIDDLYNSFTKITGLGKTNDVFLISFFDFYIFTWLSHFGLINYLDGNDYDPVIIEFTHQGRNLLQHLPV